VVKFPTRDSTGSTLLEVFRAAAGPNEEPEVVQVSGAVGREDVERVLANWEDAVAGQLGKKIPFKRHREFTSKGHFVYVTKNRAHDAVAVLEDGTYGSTAAVNRARFGLSTSNPSLPPGTSRG
jgi:hypothetical protein